MQRVGAEQVEVAVAESRVDLDGQTVVGRQVEGAKQEIGRASCRERV